MLQFWIVRAGTTEFERQGRVLGTLDVPLHSDADQEIEEIIRHPNGQPIDVVYTSPGQSSIETAERLCEAWGLRYKLVELLQNIDLGLWQGLLFEEVKHNLSRPFCRQFSWTVEAPYIIKPVFRPLAKICVRNAYNVYEFYW